MVSGKELREWHVKNNLCERHLCLLEMVVDLFGDGGDVTTERVIRQARTSHQYLEDYWVFSLDEQSREFQSRDIVDDLRQMHQRGYIFMDRNKGGIIFPTEKARILYEQIYGKGTFRMPPENQ